VIVRGLHEYLDDLQVLLNGGGQALQDTFFSPRLAGPEGASPPAPE